MGLANWAVGAVVRAGLKVALYLIISVTIAVLNAAAAIASLQTTAVAEWKKKCTDATIFRKKCEKFHVWKSMFRGYVKKLDCERLKK